MFGDVGQVGVTGGGGGAGMTEQVLDMTQAQPLLKQMGGVGVAQRMNRDFFLIPHCSTTAFMAACVPPRSMWVAALRMKKGGQV